MDNKELEAMSVTKAAAAAAIMKVAAVLQGPMYRLYGRTSSVNTQKVLWCLEECKVPFELVHASKWLGPKQNQYKGQIRCNPRPLVDTDEFAKMNPFRSIPVLERIGAQGEGSPFRIFESATILRYLAKKHAPELIFGGGAEREADVEQWMDWTLSQENTKLGVKRLIDNTTRLEKEEQSDEALIAAIADFGNALETVNAVLLERMATFTGHYLAGKDFSVADIQLGALVCRWSHAVQIAISRGLYKGDDDERLPKLWGIDTWYGKISQRPAFRSGVEDPEKMHIGMATELRKKQLPRWHREYIEK